MRLGLPHIICAPSEIQSLICLYSQHGRGTLYYAASLCDANLLQKLIEAGANDGRWVRPAFWRLDFGIPTTA